MRVWREPAGKGYYYHCIYVGILETLLLLHFHVLRGWGLSPAACDADLDWVRTSSPVSLRGGRFGGNVYAGMVLHVRA